MKIDDLINLVIFLASRIILLKTFFIIFALVLIVTIILLLTKNSWLKFIFLQDLVEFFTFNAYGSKKIHKQWRKILERMEKDDESESKLAVIEADNLLNDVLQRSGFKGENLDERLEQLNPEIIPNLAEVSETHRIYNNIIHDPDYRLSIDEARKILAVYEKTFQDLEVF